MMIDRTPFPRGSRARLLVAGSLLVAFASPLHANGVLRDSLGAVSSGRGGANASHSDNLSVLHDNPAGAAFFESAWNLELSGDFLLRDVKYRDPTSADSANKGVFFLPQLALAARLPDSPFTFGLIATLPGGYGVDFDLDHPTFGPQEYDSDGILLKVLPVVSVALGDHVAVGGGVGLGYSTAKFALPHTLQAGTLAGQEGLLDVNSDGFGVTWNLGIQIRPTERLSIGIAYVSQTETEQEGDFDVDVTGTPLAGLVSDPTAAYDLDWRLRWPRSVHAGISYTFDCGRISVDGAWINWQDAFDKFRLNLSEGDNPEFDALAGPTPREKLPLRWRDSVSIRLGYEHFLASATTLRVGYIYNLNAIPDDTLTPLLPGILEHTISAGLGQSVGLARIDFAYQYAFSTERTVGQSDLIGGDFDQSSQRAEAHWFFVTVKVNF